MSAKYFKFIMCCATAFLAFAFVTFGENISPLPNRHQSGFYSVYSPDRKIGTIKTFLAKMSDMEYKKRFWENVKQRHTSNGESYYIYSLVFGRKKYNIPAWNEARKLLDDFLTSTPECPSYPELLYAVVPSEENVTWGGQLELQNKIYDYLKKKYKLKVYQWLSEPYAPRTSIKADGWIFDAYGIQGEAFYRHLQKFMLYGKPVIPVLWAAEPGLNGFYKKNGIKDIIKNVGPKIKYCNELDLPVLLFACDKKHGSYLVWKNSTQAPFPELRKFFLDKLKQLESVKPEVLESHQLPELICSANKDNISVEEIKFNDFSFVDYCLVKGVHNLRLDKEGLHFIRKTQQNTSLTWHIKANTFFVKGTVKLFVAKKSDVKFEYSTDQQKWHEAKVTEEPFLSLNIEKSKSIYLRIIFVNDKAILKKMILSAKHTPVIKKAIALKNNNGSWNYKENFNNQKFKRHMNFKQVDQLLCRKGAIGLLGKKGYAVSWTASQEFTLPEAVNNIDIQASCYVNKLHLRGMAKVGISLDGKNIIKEVSPKFTKKGQVNFRLQTKVKLPKSQKHFYIHLKLYNGSGVFSKNSCAAMFYNYQVKAK